VLAASSHFFKNCLDIVEGEGDDITSVFLPDFEISEFRLIYPFLYGYSAEFDPNISSDLVQTLQLGQYFQKVEFQKVEHIQLDQIQLQQLTSPESIPIEIPDNWCIEPIEPQIDSQVDLKIEPKILPEEPTLQTIKSKYDDTIQCFHCHVPIHTVEELKTHLEINKKCSEKNFICPECPPECPKFFDSHIKVIRHRVVHRHEAKFHCDNCQKNFKSKKILTTHLSKVHGIHRNMEYQCPKCPSSFNFANHLKAHVEKHSIPNREPDLFCEHCDMIFNNRSALNYHMQKHVKPKYQCTKCPKSFQSEFGLKYHLKIHNNEAHYLCDDCGKKFISPYKLVQHRRAKHTLERPYICEECGEGFVRNDKLTVHRRRAHTGERPYPCDLCEWRGVDSSSLIHHKKKHIKQISSNISVNEKLLNIDV